MTNLDELQLKLNKVTEYVTNNNYDKAIVELKEGIEKSDCSICKLELALIVADVNYNKEVCTLDGDICVSYKSELLEKIQMLKKDFSESQTI